MQAPAQPDRVDTKTQAQSMEILGLTIGGAVFAAVMVSIAVALLAFRWRERSVRRAGELGIGSLVGWK